MMEGATILLVDDDATFLEVIGSLLETDGHRVLTASNGLEAVDILEGQAVDLVITDLKMPYSDGLTLLESIRFRYPKQKVIMVSGYATVEKTIEAWRQGLDDFLTKPFALEDLRGAINRILVR